MSTKLSIICLISLICQISLIKPTFAETTTCGTVEIDLGAAAAKGPSQYLEVTVPAGASKEETASIAEAKLKQEIKFDNYSSLLTTNLAKTYQEAATKLQPPDQTPTVNPQESKAQVYVTACVADTTEWLPVTKQDITALNTASLSQSAQATSPLKTYLTTLPPNPAREQEWLTGQQTALTSLGVPSSPDLPGLSLHTRIKDNEGDPGESQVYWDLCVTPSPTGCVFNNFVTEVALGDDLRVIAPSTSWGQVGNGSCISSEQLPGVAPFTINNGGSTAVSVRIFGQAQSSQADVKCESSAAGVSAGGRSAPVMCPGVYTPPGHVFQSQQTCISGSCIFNPVKIAGDIAGSLWQSLLDATAACQGTSDPVTCLRNLVITKKVPIYTYYYLSGGNYGLNLGNTVEGGQAPGFNNLFRPPQTKFSGQGAQETAGLGTDTTYLQHALGPVKTTYTQIQCDFLTPPGQQSHCDKTEIQ